MRINHTFKIKLCHILWNNFAFTRFIARAATSRTILSSSMTTTKTQSCGKSKSHIMCLCVWNTQPYHLSLHLTNTTCHSFNLIQLNVLESHGNLYTARNKEWVKVRMSLWEYYICRYAAVNLSGFIMHAWGLLWHTLVSSYFLRLFRISSHWLARASAFGMTYTYSAIEHLLPVQDE